MKPLALPFLLAVALPAADSPIVPGMNAFTTACYQQLAGADANRILSPFNVATALSMALAGARGGTSQEMQSVLHAHYDSTYDAALGALLDDLTKSANSAGNELHTANGLWVQQGFAILPAFENTLANNYHAPLTLLDFIANPEAARVRINRWTEDHTKEKIKDLFPPGSFDARTRLVLTSAIYFYGKWQEPFVPSRTQPAPFLLPAGAATQANFMNQTARFGYTETASAQILEMRYAGTGMAFDVLLPKAGTGFADFQKSLTSENLTGSLGNLTSRNVQVSLPKFRAESQFSIRQALSAMGMPTAFSDQADFSGIASKHKLAISEVVHKAFVDVAEEGTEAAAATGITMHTMAAHIPEKPVIFRADHPFVFLIRDTRTGVVLFVGQLVNPQLVNPR